MNIRRERSSFAVFPGAVMSNHVVQMKVPSLLTAPSDTELVAALAQGDLPALDELIRRHQAALRHFVRRLVADEVQAEDLAQETLLRAVAQARSFRAESSFRTWLFAIARFACIDHLRRLSRTPIDAGFHAANELPNRTAPLERMPDAAASKPDRIAMESEVREQVLEAVDALPPDLRRVFVLRVLGDLRFPEIAEVLGVGLPTVKSRMRYAVARLRDMVGDFDGWLTGSRAALAIR